MYKSGFGLFQRKAKSLAELSSNQSVIISFEDVQLMNQVAMIGLTEADLRIVKQLKPVIDSNLVEIIDIFYSELVKISILKKVIYDYSSPEKLKEKMFIHLTEVMEGNFDERYIQQRLKIAEIHYRVGLEPHWYMGHFNFYRIHFSLFYIRQWRKRKIGSK